MITTALSQVLVWTQSAGARSARRWLAILLAAASWPAAAQAAAMLKKAEVTAVINDVKVVDPSSGERAASVSDVVQGALGIKTGIKSRAELLFQDKTLTRLGANTSFSFNEGTRELELEKGTMLLQVPKNAGGAKIRTAAVTAAITGTTIMLEYTPVKWKPSQPPGVSGDVAKMAPEQCLLELQHPKRSYSAPDLAELRRKAAIAQKNTGHVKVMVLEGTLRLFLNNRMGESTLIGAGQMVILSPTALTIPPSVNYDIAQLAKTSLLVNNANWSSTATQINMAAVSREIAAQEKLKGDGSLQETNLVIPGGGTEVFTFAQLAQSLSAQNTLLFAQGNQQDSPPSGLNPPGNQNSDNPGNGPSGGISAPASGVRAPASTLSLATSTPYPSAGPATHEHSDLNSGEVSVGTYLTFEEVRGVTEFNIADAAPGSLASLSFKVSKLADDFYPDGGPGNFTINILGYVGDNVANLSDYNIATLGLIGSFSTNGLTIGQSFTFDASSILASALAANAFSLGIRLEAATDPGDGIGVTFNGFSLTFEPPGKYAPLGVISSPDPYIVDNTTQIATDPTITTGGVSHFGRIYRNDALDGAYTQYAFGATSAYDTKIQMGDYYADDAAGGAVFKFSNLTITGQPTFNTTGGAKYVDLISVATINSATPGGTINLDGIDGLFLATVNGSITLGPELSFTSSRVYTLPPGDFTEGHIPPGLYFEAYARGATSNVNFASSVNFTGDRKFFLEAEQDVLLTGNIVAPHVFLAANRNVVLGVGGSITAGIVEIWSNNVSGAGGLINGGDVSISIDGTATVTQTAGRLVVNTLPTSTTGLTRFRVTAPDIQLPAGLSAPILTEVDLEGAISSSADISGGDIELRGPATVNGTVTTTGKLSIFTLTATGAVVATDGLTGYEGNSSLAIASLTAPSIAVGGLGFDGSSGEIETINGVTSTRAPTAAQTLTLTADTVSFGFGDFYGGSAEISSGMAGGDGGTFNVITQNDVTIAAGKGIYATTGANANGVASGGNGGAVDINTAGGQITVDAAIQVSSNDVPNRRVSAKGGNIKLQTGKATGPGITVSNTGQLLSLLNATAPGPGGTIQVTSAGANINIDGNVQADRGTIDVRNNGADGQVFIGANAQLAADVVKVGALGTNGQLTINAGSRLNAVSTLKLYGGTGSLGKVQFTGAGQVNLSGSQINIRANTVQIDGATHVNNNGATSVHATNHNYGTGAGGGNFQNPVTAGPTSGAPSF